MVAAGESLLGAAVGAAEAAVEAAEAAPAAEEPAEDESTSRCIPASAPDADGSTGD